jgi:hypothetical protein
MRLPVRFDDRLRTVLGQSVRDSHDRAVRWRQLVDLVARAGGSDAAPLIAEALAAIRADLPLIDEKLRAAAARSISGLPLPAELVAIFASDSLAVSAPVLAGAKLTTEQWRTVISGTDAETRRFVATIHPDAGVSTDESPGQSASAVPSISDVVARVERVRRSRDGKEHRAAATEPAPAAQGGALFRWECGPSGEITWVEGVPRGPLIGRSIARSDEMAQVDHDLERAFAMRGPFRDAPLALAGEGPAAGKWKISGVPAFEPADGRFAGYRGIALREGAPKPSERRAESLLRLRMPDPDSLRELVHEIKTPLNAIIGFAEIIDGQYLGPANRPYRARASEIVQQARLLLLAIDDLDFAAKVHSANASEQRRANIGRLVEHMTPELRELGKARGVELDASRTTRDSTAAIEPELADRLILRMCSGVIARSGPGEHLRLSVDRSHDQCDVSITKPAALQGLSDDELFGSGAVIGEGFELRLARGMARLAGADLVSTSDAICLRFPSA